ncbi:MAG: inositol monophosphatase family protein [Acidimicrobiales bacterium]
MTDLPDELLALAVHQADRAARLLLDGLRGPRVRVDTKSSVTDFVTEMDRASERLIVDGILAARPDDGILGEEGATVPGMSGVRWVIDPLDGTTNFLYRLPGFAVSIAAEVDGTTVAGVVHDVVHAEVFTAARGGGARLNGEPIGPTGLTDPERALVATGFSYVPERRHHQAQVLARVLHRIGNLRRVGAAAVDICMVACGRADAYFEWGLSPWDWAAGRLVAEEAGARTGELDGDPALPASLLVATPAVFDRLKALIDDAITAVATTRNPTGPVG